MPSHEDLLKALMTGAGHTAASLKAPVDARSAQSEEIAGYNTYLQTVRDRLAAVASAANNTNGLSANVEIKPAKMEFDAKAGARIDAGMVSLMITIAPNPSLAFLGKQSYAAQGGGFNPHAGRGLKEEVVGLRFYPGRQVYTETRVLANSDYLGGGPTVSARDENTIMHGLQHLFTMLGTRAPHCATQFASNYKNETTQKLQPPSGQLPRPMR